jgi:aspartate kinase
LAIWENGLGRRDLKNLLIMKFGGTSMGSAERMRVAAQIIAEQRKLRPLAVVVSAMSKVTDLLLETLRRAEVGDTVSVGAGLETLRARHLEAAEELLGQDAAAEDDIANLVSEFQRIANGILMLGERPPRSVDEAIAIGERLSAALLARYLEASGTRALAVNGGDVIVTDAVFGN